MPSSLARRLYPDSQPANTESLDMFVNDSLRPPQSEELPLALLPQASKEHPKMPDTHRDYLGEEYAVCYRDRHTQEIRCETSLDLADREALMQFFGQIIAKASMRRANPSPASTSFSEEEEEEEEEEDEETENANDTNCDAEIQGARMKIGDHEKIWKVYDDRLKAIGQICLKKILKAWIREIHPQKQAKFPYNGGKKKDEAISLFGEDNKGDLTKPEWWPPTLRHREPDHQMKPERLTLAHHLLRNSGFTSDMFRRSTTDIVFDTRYKESVPALLNEVYSVRATEEQFEKNELDANAEVVVSKKYLDVQRARPRPKLPKAETTLRRCRKNTVDKISKSKEKGGTKTGESMIKQTGLPLTPTSLLTPLDPSQSFRSSNHDTQDDGRERKRKRQRREPSPRKRQRREPSPRKRERREPSPTRPCLSISHPTSSFGPDDSSSDVNVPDLARPDTSISFQENGDMAISATDYTVESFSTGFDGFATADEVEPALRPDSSHNYSYTSVQGAYMNRSTGVMPSPIVAATSLPYPTTTLQNDLPPITSSDLGYSYAEPENVLCPHGWPAKCTDCEVQYTRIYATSNADDVQTYQPRLQLYAPTEGSGLAVIEPNALEHVAPSGIDTGMGAVPFLPAMTFDPPTFTPFAPVRLYHAG